jgi:hypothetical protein
MLPHLFYSSWTYTFSMALISGVLSLGGGDNWLARTALVVSLVLLLVTGVVLLSLGLRDLARDVRHSVQAGSHKKSHV